MVACQGILACRRKDSRGELVMSNCREPSEILLEGEDKNQVVSKVTCPTALADYSKPMGSVDDANQMVTLCALDKKNQKW